MPIQYTCEWFCEPWTWPVFQGEHQIHFNLKLVNNSNINWSLCIWPSWTSFKDTSRPAEHELWPLSDHRRGQNEGQVQLWICEEVRLNVISILYNWLSQMDGRKHFMNGAMCYRTCRGILFAFNVFKDISTSKTMGVCVVSSNA